MKKVDAKKAAEAGRKQHGVPDTYRLQTIEQQYIELAGDDPSQPAPVRDVLVWSAKFWGDEIPWIELSVDDDSGKVVRTLNSR